MTLKRFFSFELTFMYILSIPSIKSIDNRDVQWKYLHYIFIHQPAIFGLNCITERILNQYSFCLRCTFRRKEIGGRNIYWISLLNNGGYVLSVFQSKLWHTELVLPSTSRLCPLPPLLPIRQQVIGCWLLGIIKIFP